MPTDDRQLFTCVYAWEQGVRLKDRTEHDTMREHTIIFPSPKDKILRMTFTGEIKPTRIFSIAFYGIQHCLRHCSSSEQMLSNAINSSSLVRGSCSIKQALSATSVFGSVEITPRFKTPDTFKTTGKPEIIKVISSQVCGLLCSAKSTSAQFSEPQT